MEYTEDRNVKQKKAAEYSRKSTDSEDKQIYSLEDQHDLNLKSVKAHDLIYNCDSDCFSESKSAKRKGKREQFYSMIKKFENKEYEVIVCWHLNRLSRNAVDSGIIIDLMDRECLYAIITPGKTYYNTPDDKLLMCIEFGLSKKTSDDLWPAVRRGMTSKVYRKWWPGTPKPGYLNYKQETFEETKQKIDPIRFPLLRLAIEMFLTGHYSVPKILDHLNNELGYKTRKTAKTGNLPMVQSKLYKLFRDPYYYGKLVWNSEESIVDESVPRLLSEDEFWKIQDLLGKKGLTRPNKHFGLPYKGLIKCPVCGGCVIPYIKQKTLKSGELKDYFFLRCSKNKVHIKCNQSQITFHEFEKQVLDILDSITISEEFYKWAISWVKKQSIVESKSQEQAIEAIEKELHSIKYLSENLLNMRITNEITSQEFQIKKTEIGEKQVKLQKTLLDLHKGRNEWLDKANMYLDYAKNAAFKFEHGTYQEKADIAHGLGANLVLMDTVVGVELLEPYIKFKDNNFVLHQKPNELELANALVAKDKSEITDPVILSWWGGWESNPHSRFFRPVP